MFSETNKYKNSGHFFFKNGDKLSEVSKDVPELPGVYYIIKLVKGRIELVYIGKSGTIKKNAEFKGQMLKKRINNTHENMSRQDYFTNKILTENIDALEVYWFVTHDEVNKDLPAYVEGLLIQRYYDINRKLPLWNKDF